MHNHSYECILDAVEEGLIVIDQFGKVRTYNKRAKEITGIILNQAVPHPSGKLEKGDLVIIADNRLGYDDGELTSGDLKKIGVQAKDISQGEAFVAIGLYEVPDVKGVVKHWRNKAGNERMQLQTQFQGHRIEAEIDVAKKTIGITVDERTYKMRYSLAIGHIVVLDALNRETKFYQAKGYSIRQETVAEILSGKPYLSKGQANETIDVIGMPLNKVFDSTTLLSRIDMCIAGSNDFFENEYYEIHKRPTLCSLSPLNEDKDMLLRIFDVSNIESLISERNKLIVAMEKTNKSYQSSIGQKIEWQTEGIIGYSNAMQHVKYLVQRASKTKSTVLITGESGTGKTFIAKEIHNLMNPMQPTPFISVNCTAIPQHLFESELFGYNKGAFTGAEKSGKMGLFELANGGTLFLDEIGELPLEMQVKLLHVLQNKAFYKVGAVSPTHVDVRIIAATNKNLIQEMENKTFREDLYYRINGFPIEMPPLRKRKSDLYPMINALLERLAKDFNSPIKLISGEAFDRLVQYEWPGNIRELENTIELAYNMSDGPVIDVDDLNLPERQIASNGLRDYLDSMEKEYIEMKLIDYDYDTKKTIDALKISKTVFYDKVKKHTISLKKM